MHEINNSLLVNQRKKYRILPKNNDKIPNPIFLNIYTRKGVTEKLLNFSYQNIVSNKLILNDLQQNNETTTQNKIFENVKNL